MISRPEQRQVCRLHCNTNIRASLFRLQCPDFVLLQVARQEGEYLARLLKQHNPGHQSQGKGALPRPQKPFKYTHLGSLAYVGADKAVMDIPKMGPVTGWTAGTASALIIIIIMIIIIIIPIIIIIIIII